MTELAADGIPVAVTCRVLDIARQPYYRWRARPVTVTELDRAYRANVLFDAHRDDPEFGYRFLADEARDAGQSMADRTAWRICSAMGWWSAFGKKRGRTGKKTGPPVHDDLVRREFTAAAPNLLWLADITEHRTAWIPAVVATPTGGVGRCQLRSTPWSRRSASSSWSTGVALSEPRLRPRASTRARPIPGYATLA
ncbi:hypothetical protein [Actinophytocola oryzae]|uniref:hypothetical protein n=1 Tax=Actinophytocola oryzae TaxID=502181 RepID=UPI001AAECD59|nr:hypothetical protein [Actinophytocola oryzae]